MHAKKDNLEESILRIPEDESAPFLGSNEKTSNALKLQGLIPNDKNAERDVSRINKVVVLGIALLLMVIIFSLLFNFIISNKANDDYKIRKSRLDTRLYRAIVLPNDLKVLLISDDEAETAGVALNVGVGSWDEPSEFPGLAHFLEHMLFMGSEKYPNVNEFNVSSTNK